MKMHMHSCPHCRAPGVRNIDVRWSRREWPARCNACGRLCHVLASTDNGIDSVCLVLLSLAVLAGLLLTSWLAFASALALVVAYNLWAWRRVELFPISEESARNGAAALWVVVIVGTVARIFST
jgi:hypothetical protein